MVRMADRLTFTKGHGTENDFVLVPDLDGALDLTAARAAWLADRRAGIGGDGVIRVVPADLSDDPAVRAQAGSARWFMDYRNADGSLSEMCGNGTRVLAAYLCREGLETADEFAIATRAGVKNVRRDGDGFAVDLDTLDLTRAPRVRPEPQRGTNVELVRPMGPGHIAMRVHERGIGETRSCGTGACAAAIATSFWAGDLDTGSTWLVDVPGGRLTVRLLPDYGVELAGPAVLVADGTVDLARLP